VDEKGYIRLIVLVVFRLVHAEIDSNVRADFEADELAALFARIETSVKAQKHTQQKKKREKKTHHLPFNALHPNPTFSFSCAADGTMPNKPNLALELFSLHGWTVLQQPRFQLTFLQYDTGGFGGFGGGATEEGLGGGGVPQALQGGQLAGGQLNVGVGVATASVARARVKMESENFIVCVSVFLVVTKE
jgi:hypothetical protein